MGQAIGQSEEKNGKTIVNHGGVYAGMHVFDKEVGPVHAVYQSVSPNTGVNGKNGGPILTPMNDNWDVWMWHDGVILDLE